MVSQDRVDGIRSLTRDSLLQGVAELCDRDTDLACVVDRFGAPPLWARKPGFATLVRIVLEQQVSLSSAKATYERLRAELGSVTAQLVAQRRIADLRALGITRQKADYCSNLARLIVKGELDLRQIARADDSKAHQRLCAIRGIGPTHHSLSIEPGSSSSPPSAGLCPAPSGLRFCVVLPVEP